METGKFFVLENNVFLIRGDFHLSWQEKPERENPTIESRSLGEIVFAVQERTTLEISRGVNVKSLAIVILVRSTIFSNSWWSELFFHDEYYN